MSTPVDAPDIEDLRTRRRRETTVEASEAAMDLFESRGMANTTVDEIAHRAGISTRTFFRLCHTKEDAIFTGSGEFEDALAGAVAKAGDVREATVRLRRAWVGELRKLDDDREGRARYLRVRRLVSAEPLLLAAAVRRDIELARRLVDALTSTGHVTAAPARVVVERAALITRIALDEWVVRADAGAPERLDALYLQVEQAFDAVGH